MWIDRIVWRRRLPERREDLTQALVVMKASLKEKGLL
jgi:hypothetical protein